MRNTIRLTLILLLNYTMALGQLPKGWSKSAYYYKHWGLAPDSLLVLPKTLTNSSLLEDGAIRYNSGIVQLRKSGVWGGFSQLNIIGLQDSLLDKPTLAAADARYVLNRTSAAQAGGFNMSGTGTVAGIMTMGNGSNIKGSGFGSNNVALFSFYETNGVTRKGYIGDSSSSTSHIYFGSDAGDIWLNSNTGQYYLRNGNNNWINWNQVGYSNPTFGSTSVGTKLLLNQNVGVASANYAIGIGNNNIWLGLPQAQSSQTFDFFGGITRGGYIDATGGMEMAAMGRYKGWYTSGTGPGLEVGYISGISTVQGFDRTTNLYTPLSLMGGTTATPQTLLIDARGAVIGTTASAARLHTRGSSTSTGLAFLAENSAGSSLFEVGNNGMVRLKNGIEAKVNVQTANYSVVSSDCFVVQTGAATSVNIGLPTAGRVLIIKNRSGGNIAINITGGATVEGSGTAITLSNGDVLRLSGQTTTDWFKW